jgi:O-antigen/teichoic acid export membrane protein
MVPAAFVVQTFLTFERFVVTAQHGATDLSQFAVGVGLAGNAMLTYTIIGNMLYPMMVQARRAREGGRERRLVEQGLAAFLFIAIPVLCVIPVVSVQLVPLLTSASYALAPLAFAGLLVGAAGFGVHQLAGYVFYLEERTHELLSVLLVALVVKAALAFLLIPRLGVAGAVWSYAAGGSVLAIVTMVRARQLMPFTIPWRLIGAASTQGLALGAVTWLGASRFPDGQRVGPVLIALGALGAFGLLQRNRVLQMLRGDA